MPCQRRALHADRELAHAREYLELFEPVRRPYSGDHRVELLEERGELGLRPALHGLAHERRRRGRDRAPGAFPADVLDPVAVHLRGDGDLVAAERVVARRAARRLLDQPRVPRLLVVVEDDLLVQIAELMHGTPPPLSSARRRGRPTLPWCCRGPARRAPWPAR